MLAYGYIKIVRHRLFGRVDWYNCCFTAGCEFATIARMPTEYGLFAGMILAIVAAVLLKYLGPETTEIATVATLPSTLSPLSSPDFSSEPSVAQCPQLRFIRIDGSLFF